MTEAVDIVKGLREEPGAFSVRDHLNGASHATDSVEIFTDGEAGGEISRLNEELACLERKIIAPGGDHDSITDGDEHDDLRAKHEEISARIEELVGRVLGTALTFHVRGVTYKQLELIFKKARKEIKPPARKNYPQTEEGEEEYNLEAMERNIARNDLINYLTVAAAIVKVVNTAGDEDASAWDAEGVENLRTNVYDSEYSKLKELVDKLTLSQNIFSGVVNRDADFLSKR